MPNKSVHKRLRSTRGWKTLQSSRQNSKKTKLALIVFGLIIILLLLSQAIKFTQMVFSPWKEVPGVKRENLWDGDFNIRLVIKSQNTALLSFNPKERKVTIVNLPENTYLRVPHGFGEWQLSSIYQLGQSQKDVGGSKLLGSTLQNLFGLPIDGVLYFSDQYAQKEPGEVVSEIRNNPLSILGVLPYLKTNLTPFELVKLNMGLSSVRFDKIKEVDLKDTPDLLIEDKLLDGTDIYKLDTIKLDSILSGMTDASFMEERKTIAIFNSTNKPGLAQKAARLITNIGGDVIFTSNGQKKQEKTIVVGEQSKTLLRLRQIFGAGDIIDPKDGDLVSSRAQINIFLGEDYIE